MNYVQISLFSKKATALDTHVSSSYMPDEDHNGPIFYMHDEEMRVSKAHLLYLINIFLILYFYIIGDCANFTTRVSEYICQRLLKIAKKKPWQESNLCTET